VERLFLPYIPLEKRLLLVFEETFRDHEFVESVVNPARHLAEAGGDNLGQVIYIVGGEHGGPPEAFRVAERPPEFPFETGIKYPRDSTEEVPPGEAVGSGESWVSKTLYVSDREPFTIVGLWEFVFFNKESKRATDEFLGRVKTVVGQWRWGEWLDDQLEIFVSKLKELYEVEFPQGRPRNDISLVTYSGPVADTWANCHSCTSDLYPAHRSLEWPFWSLFRHCGRAHSDIKYSHLYFGDLALKKALLERKLKPHLGDTRWSQILVMHVPHHGAKNSWFKNAASSFFHEYSVFSYGMGNSYGHPAKMVWDDLKCHRPMLVNEFQGALFCGWLMPKYLR
jgi:hypothetical protein